MSREILFKAKHIHTSEENEYLDGKWVEGYLCDKNYIYSLELEGQLLIDENTVCQYIGLTDKNSRKIFEGDIVLIDGEDEYFTVEWDNDTARFVMNSKTLMVDFDNYWNYQVEVIGNIFDNPKLLEGGTE